MKIKITKDGYFIAVTKKYDIKWFAVLEGAAYLAKTKHWFIPNTKANRKILKRKGILSDLSVQKVRAVPKDLFTLLPKCLYDVQREALQFAYKNYGNCILALDMGLGKTAISLFYTVIEPSINCTVIVCPASLKIQWKAQIKQWLHSEDVHIIYGRTSYKIPQVKFIIINYEIFKDHIDTIREVSPDLLIVDEIQNFQNHKALRTKALYSLTKTIDRVLALSGTPITKSPAQFFPILHILEPYIFSNEFIYKRRYCNAYQGRYGWVFDGVSNVEELREILSNIMIRRKKEDCLDIPKKLIIPIVFAFDYQQSILYAEEEARFLELSIKSEQKKSLVHLQYLAYLGKRDEMFKWITDIIKTDKLVIFCEHRKIVEDIYEHFQNTAVKYYGGMSDKQRQTAKKQFTQSKQLFIGNTTSAGIGLDGLQHVCSTVAFVELPWTATRFDQATDRLWRSGQKNIVNVYVLMAEHSVELHIMKILDKSRAVVEQIIDGKAVEEINFLKELIKTY